MVVLYGGGDGEFLTIGGTRGGSHLSALSKPKTLPILQSYFVKSKNLFSLFPTLPYLNSAFLSSSSCSID